MCPVVGISPALVHHRRQAGGLHPAVVGVQHHPFEEGEDFRKGIVTRGIAHGALVDGAVAPADIDGQLRNARFVGVPEAVAIRVIEEAAFQGAKPAERKNVAQVDECRSAGWPARAR